MSNHTFKIGETELMIRTPTVPEQKESEKIYRKAFKAACDNGDYLRVRLNDVLKAQGLWDKEKEIEHDTLVKRILDGEKRLAKAGIKLSEAKSIAIENIKLRKELVKLTANRNQLDAVTVEAQADNEKFNYLVSACTVYKDNGKPYFKSYEDFLSKSGTVEGQIAAVEMMKVVYNWEENEDAKLPEYKFLKKWGFVDDKLRLINKDKKLVDEDGRPVNEEGYYINEKGERIDINGDLVDENGNWKVEEEIFYDEDGKPVNPPSEEVSEIKQEEIAAPVEQSNEAVEEVK